MRIPCVFIAAVLLVSSVRADDASEVFRKPTDTLFFEAEEMKTDGRSWIARDHNDGDYFGCPSGLKVLTGGAGGAGSASCVLDIPSAGRYRVWVRYLDIHPNAANEPRSPFNLRLMQSGKCAAEKAFDAAWLRAKPEAMKKYDSWARTFVWDSMDADLSAGTCTLELSKLDPLDTCWRWVDCFVLTTDVAYEPDIAHFVKPIYLKIAMSKTGNSAPVLFNIWGGCGHVTVSRAGIRLGHMAFPPEARVAAGDESPWVNVAGTLTKMSGQSVVRLDALTEWYVPTAASEFQVSLSRTPSDDGLIGRFHRRGSGGGIRILIDPTHLDQTKDASQTSREILRAVETLSPAHGRPPTRFPVITGLYDDVAYTPPDVIDNDVRALELLGFSGTANSSVPRDKLRAHGLVFNSSQCTTYWALKDQCLNQPNWDTIRSAQAENLKHYAPGDVQWIKLMDEIYSVSLDHLKACPVCAEKFAEYLKSQGFPPAAPVVDKTRDPKLFYHTMRFRSQMQVDFLKGCTAIVRELRPGVHTIANATTELTFSNSMNLLTRGTDWFELYKQRALTFGFIQDANACTPTQQTVSYTMDFLRSACKYHPDDQPYGLYNMITRTPWDIGAKAFAEVGHGARLIDFYNWGPHYADGCDAQSQRAELYPVLREFNHAVGAVENELLQARPAASKIALLYSHTTDIWDLLPQDWACDKRIFGGELMYLHLLLSHLGYPVDILTEDDVLEGRAASYQAVLVTGSHLKDGVLAALLDWVKSSGGILYLSAGAAERNQYNEPIRELEGIGLKREAFVYHQPPGHEDELPGMQVIARASVGQEKLDVVGGLQKLSPDTKGRITTRLADEASSACGAEIAHGKGRVIFVGFFPATTYVRGGCIALRAERETARAAGTTLASWNPPSFPEGPRRLFGEMLTPVEYRPPVRVSDYLVEACMLRGPNASVIALANWSGRPQKIQVALQGAQLAGEPRAAIGTLRNVRREADSLLFGMEVERGDFVVIPTK